MLLEEFVAPVVMDRILAGLDFVRCYINDILVYSDIVEEHLIHLQMCLND
jgi:hypothetical protein